MMYTMKPRARDRLLRLLENPPKGSRIAAAKEFGVDLTLNVRKLGLTPTERMEEMQSFQSFLEALRQAIQEQAR